MTTVAKKQKFNTLDDTVEVLLGTMPVTLRMKMRYERLRSKIFNDDYLFEGPKFKKNFSPAPPPPAVVEAPKERVKRTKTFWTNERIAKLRELYPKMKAREVAKELGVTRVALYSAVSLFKCQKQIKTNYVHSKKF
jgi:hypothetical protein